MKIIMLLTSLFTMLTVVPNIAMKENHDMQNNNPRLSSSTIATANKLFDHGVAGVDQYYNYCPSIFEENGVRHIYYCANKDVGNVTDYIAYRSGTYQAGIGWTYSDISYVLSPTSGTWDARHTCDPSVVKGIFTYNGVTYQYLMNYLASTQDDSMGNGTGFAVSHLPEGPWIKCDDINPTIPFDAEKDVWGNGQTCMINLDQAGCILYFYSYGGNDGTYEIVREYDLSNLNNITLLRQVNLSKNGQISGDIGNNDAEFAYDVTNKKLIMVKAKHPYNTDGLSPTFVSESLIVYVLDLSGNDNPIDEIFKGSSQKNWIYLGTIDQSISGFPRNHNPGLVTDQYGRVLSDSEIEIDFSVSITSDTFWSYLSTYRLYSTILTLTYGKFASERLNNGANISFKSSEGMSDISTLRIWLGDNVETDSDGLYLRMRNYTSIETPIDIAFENKDGYYVKATPNAPFITYRVDGKVSTSASFRSFGSYLMLPIMFDGFIYIPFSSMMTDEVGTRDLSTIRYIYLSVSTYYDSYTRFSVGDIFDEWQTFADVSSFSSGTFNYRFLPTSGVNNLILKQLTATDINPLGKDLLGGIHMTINRDETTDRSAQWILKNQGEDLSGEGLYLRLKNNSANPFWIVFYVLATNNHRMQLGQNLTIKYYDTSANYTETIESREFGTYFYLPSNFDGFIFIPYSSLIDESSWSGNTGTSMTYDHVYSLYFGASAYYDYLLDLIVGDVFTTNNYLYDGSLSRYDNFSTFAEKVWNQDYVNIAYADGYKRESTCYAENFLSLTYPCSTEASSSWGELTTLFTNLSSDAKTELQEATYGTKTYAECSEIEKCAWRYDLAVARQGLNDFMNRLSINPFRKMNDEISHDFSLFIPLVITCLSLLTFGYIFYQKRRFIN